MRLPSVVHHGDGRCAMRVQRVLMPGSRVESWTVLDDDLVPVDPVERFLAYLSSIERSPNTVKAYAHDLKDWFIFLGRRGLDWRSVTIEDVAGYVAWLRLPPEARDGLVQVLPTVAHHCAASSVNRKLAALTSFCEFHARHGVPLAGLLVTMAPAGRGRSSASSFKPFLHHITKSAPQQRRAITLASSQPRPRVLTAAEAQAILDACEHLRDRLSVSYTHHRAHETPEHLVCRLLLEKKKTKPIRSCMSSLLETRTRIQPST